MVVAGMVITDTVIIGMVVADAVIADTAITNRPSLMFGRRRCSRH
jgi:hypothetical protein